MLFEPARSHSGGWRLDVRLVSIPASCRFLHELGCDCARTPVLTKETPEPAQHTTSTELYASSRLGTRLC